MELPRVHLAPPALARDEASDQQRPEIRRWEERGIETPPAAAIQK
jgi:hypothetical protein